MIIIIMGVSGCGKTTIGKQLSKETNIPFFDGDDFHPESNIKKMAQKIPLNDADRFPWLNLLAHKLEEWSKMRGAILACSALKETYRTWLTSKCKDVIWVYLSGDVELIEARIKARKGHFMNVALLESQFKDLEIPKYGIQADVTKPPNDIINHIISKL